MKDIKGFDLGQKKNSKLSHACVPLSELLFSLICSIIISAMDYWYCVSNQTQHTFCFKCVLFSLSKAARFHKTFSIKICCAAKAFYSCPAIISRRPGSQDTSKESQLNSEKDSRRKQARSHVTLEKSS